MTSALSVLRKLKSFLSGFVRDPKEQLIISMIKIEPMVILSMNNQTVGIAKAAITELIRLVDAHKSNPGSTLRPATPYEIIALIEPSIRHSREFKRFLIDIG